MMYWDYPAVSDADRLERAPVLDASQVKLVAGGSLRDAGIRIRRPARSGWQSFDGRPAYYFRIGRSEAIVYADTGAAAGRISAGAEPENGRRMDRTAGERREGRRADRTGSVDARGRPPQPASAVEVFVAQRRSGLRFGRHGRSGPVHHPLLALVRGARSDPTLAVLHAAAKKRTAVEQGGDLVVGDRDRRGADGIDRRADDVFAVAENQHSLQGPKRLHHILGLFFGIVACTWAFSGMLSMEPFPLSSGRPQGVPRIAGALRGKRPPLSQYAMKPPQEALAQLGPAFQVKELELSSFASEPVYIATGARGETRVIRMRGEPLESFDPKRILNVVMSAASVAEARPITQYDEYYLDRRGERPLPVLFVQLNDEAAFALLHRPEDRASGRAAIARARSPG